MNDVAPLSLLHPGSLKIEQWSDRIDSRTRLPVLLRRLVHSSTPDLLSVDFPGHDDGQRHGNDGRVETATGSAWVPSGISYWEFGTDASPTTKAGKDYAARLASISESVRSDATFVFVTPRRWPGASGWGGGSIRRRRLESRQSLRRQYARPVA